MSESNENSEFVTIQMSELERAREAEDLPRALELLQQLTDLKAPKTVDLDNLRRSIVSWKATYTNERAEQIQAAFKSEPIDEDSIRNALYELTRIDPENPSLPVWRNKLARQIDSVRMAEVSQEVEAEVERMLTEAAEAERGGRFGLELVALYREAYEYAVQMESNYPSPSLANLRAKTRTSYNLMRTRHRLAFTRQQQTQFDQLLEQLRMLEPSAMVTIALDRSDFQGTMAAITAKEALAKVEQQAREFAKEKADEYRNDARKFLREHAPAAAQDKLNDALKLIMLDEEQRSLVSKLLDGEVQQALERRRRAEDKLAQARQAGATVQAWGLLMAAADEDPHTPELEPVRSSLRPDVKRYLAERLAVVGVIFSAETPLDPHILQSLVKPDRDVEPSDIKHQLDSLLKITGQDSGFSAERREAERLLSEFASWQALTREIDKTILAEQGKIASEPQAVYHRMEERIAGWGPRVRRFPHLTAFQARVDRLANAAAQMARFSGAVANSELADVEIVLEECRAVVEAEKPDSPQRSVLEQVQRHLELHVKYLKALVLLRKSGATPGDIQLGLGLLRMVTDGQGDDQAAAAQMIGSIATDQGSQIDRPRLHPFVLGEEFHPVRDCRSGTADCR